MQTSPATGRNLPRNFSWPPIFQLTAPTGSVHKLTPPATIKDSLSEEGNPFFENFSQLEEDEAVTVEPFSWSAGDHALVRSKKPSRLDFQRGIERRWSGYFLDRGLSSHQHQASQTVSLGSDTASFNSSHPEDDDDEDFIWPGTPQSHRFERDLAPDPYHQRPKSLTNSEPRIISPRRRKYPRTMSGHHHHQQQHRLSWHEPSPHLYTVGDLDEYATPRSQNADLATQIRSRSTPNLPLPKTGGMTPLLRPQAVSQVVLVKQKWRGCGSCVKGLSVVLSGVRSAFSWVAKCLKGCWGGVKHLHTA